jgi:small-conductance mechanosensitive channel
VKIDNLLDWLAKFFGHIPVAGVEALLFKGLQAALVLLVVFVTLRILFKAIDHHYKKSDDRNKDDIRIYKRISRFFLWTLGILIALHVVGINLSSLFTTSGLLAVALGLSLKSILENYVGGLIIKSDDSIKHGDVLDIDGQMVRVKSIGIRATVVRTKDDSDILIPNSLLVQGKIGNYTHRDSVCRLWTSVGVSYSSDLKQVREVLEEVCRNFDGLSAQHAPVVLLTDFGNSSVNYQVFVWIEDPWNSRTIKSKLNEAVWWALKAAGIEIAFPQLDVHLDKSADETTPLVD